MQFTGQSLRLHRLEAGLSQAKLAELSGISQHQLSAFELGKVDLPESHASLLRAALSNQENVDKLARRRKRYQEHTYSTVEKCPQRIARAARTSGNSDYGLELVRLQEAHASPGLRPFTAVSLFSGCGGFSLGFSAAGFAINGHVELEDNLRRIYRANFPNCTELGTDITKINNERVEELVRKIGTVDVIIGGPPCQGFSLSGKRDVDDERNELFRHYTRFVAAFNPKVAILENVRLLLSMKSKHGTLVKDEIFSEFRRLGYVVRSFEVNAHDYGVPQHRERVIFIAIRDDLKKQPSLPKPTHSKLPDLFGTAQSVRTFGDACSDLPFIESGETSNDPLHTAVNHPAHVIEWLWDVPEGASAHENEDPARRPPSGYNTTYKRQVWTEPGSTVQTTSGMISGCRNVHPIATRSLTIREAARLQSFPDGFSFPGNSGDVRKAIGNAVPPLLAFAIAKYVKALL